PSQLSSDAQAQTAVRKTVTALFCDLVGSTAFGERVDAESARDAMGRYFEMARSVVEAHGGTVSKFVGDGVLALFGVPEMAEDDAERAVSCGLALQVGFEEIGRHITARYGIDVGLRVGINTGEVVIASEDEDIVGDALNTAARLEAACAPGRVLVGEPTWRLTRSVVRYGDRRGIRAKGKEELVGSYEVLEAIGPIDEVATPFVGRDAELRQLRLVLEDTILDRTAKMVTVIGSPGVGKTRLAREMRAAVDGGTAAFDLRCERSGGATFAPISELLRSIAGITDAHSIDEISDLVAATVADLDDSARVAELLGGFVGAAPMRSTEEMFFAVRRLFELLGSTQPVVFVVDDIQWAEPLFLDLLEHLVEWVKTVPLLVVGLARPEIRDLRPVLAEIGRRVTAVVNLEGLSNEATSELAAKLVGADSLPRDLLVKIPESTEGNPLFVRELMRMLVDDGVISNASGSWQMVIDIDAVEVPTINSLLASRVERMAPDERRLLELASVVGSEFPVGAIRAAGAEQSRAELDLLFERLRRRELIEPTGTYWGDEPVFRFHHVLIRDAAYRRLLKGARAELHVLVGEWTEQTASRLVGEHEVVVAHHFEQAHHYRHQLNLDDYETRALGERAASLLEVAASRALSREDLEAAGSLATRALACVDDQSSGLAELLVLACESLLGTRNVAAGAPLVDRLDEVAGTDRRLGGWVECFRAELAIATDPDGLHDAELRAEAAAVLLEELGDQAGVAKARAQRAGALARLGRVGECEEELDQALSAARAIDDRRRVTAILGAAPVAALWGPSPVPRAGGRCLDVVRLLRITTGSPAVEATSVRCQAVLEALRGRYDTARTMLATARDTLEELGQTHGLLETELYSGLVELLAQDAATAEPFLRRAYDGLGSMGIGADAGQAAAHLARALLVQGRIDEASDLASESDALAGQNPQTAIISHSVQAEVLAGRGRFDEAIVIAEEAVALGARTDILVDHANAVASLARVLSAAGQPERAVRAAAEAARLFEMKGATIELSLPEAESVEESSVAAGATLTPEPGEAAKFWNKAHESAARLLTLFVERDEAAYSDLVDDDVVSDDRRSLVQFRLDGKRDVVESAFFSGSSDVGALAVKSFEPGAVRGESLALMSTVVGPVDEAIELAWLGVTQWSDEGLLRRIVMFDPDDLVAALAELDRLYESELNPTEALIHSEYADYNLATSAMDVDGIMSRFDPSIVVDDHRQIGWPSTDDGWAQLQQRASSLAEAVESVTAINEKIHRSDSGGMIYQHRYLTVMADGAAPSQRDVILVANNPASGYVTRIEQFDELDVEGALSRFDELAAASTDLDTSLVVQAGGAINICARSGKYDRLDSFVGPGFVLEDSEGGAIVGDDLVDSLKSVGFGGPDRTVVAVRCDRLALIDVGLADGSRCFLVEEIDEHGLLTRIRRFSADQLTDALHHLVRRWIKVDESIPAALVGPLRQFLSAVYGRSAEAHEAILHQSFEFVDHNLLGAGTANRSEFINFRFSDSNPRYVALEQLVHRTSSHGMVSSGFTAIDGARVGDVVMNPHVFVLVFDGSLVRRLESFPEEQLDAALARLDELDPAEVVAPDPEQAAEFWNKAHERATGFLKTLVDRDEAAYSDAVDDNVVSDDRRSLVQLRLDGKRDVVEAAFFPGSSDLGAFVVKASTPVAVRGESLALMSTVVGLDDESVEFGFLAVTQWSDEGLLRRIVRFDPDDLVAALAALDRLHQAELPPAEALFLSEYTDYNAALAAKRVDGVISRFDPSFQLVEHRQLGWPVAESGFEQLVQRAESLVNVGQSVVCVNEKLHRSGSCVALWAQRYNVVMTDGSAPSQASLWISMANPATGYFTRAEQFDERDTAGALGRYDELVAGQTALDTSTVVEVGGAVNICLRSGKHDRLDSFVAQGFVVEDSEGHVVVGDELVGSLMSVGFGGPDRTVVAVRCDRFALIDVGLDDGTRRFLVEEIDDQGLLVRIRQFRPDQLRDAFRHLERRWTEIDLSIARELVGPIREFVGALYGGDLAAHEAAFHEDLEFVDHKLLGVGTLNRSELIDYRLSAGNTQFQSVIQLIHRTSSYGLVSSGYTSTDGARLGDVVMAPNVGLVLFEDSSVRRIEQFPADQLDAVLARFDELDSDSSSTSLPIDLSPELVNSATRLIEERWADSGSVEVLAVRFDSHALAEVTAESESFFVLLTMPADGKDPDEQRFDADSLPEAMRALDRRWIDGMGLSAPEGIEAFVALVAAMNPPDPGALAEIYAPDVSNVNHAPLLQLTSTDIHAELVDVGSAFNTDGDNISSKINRVADHLLLVTFDISNRRPNGGRWVTRLPTIGRESGGQVDYVENWDVGDIALANARFDELAAELAGETGDPDPLVSPGELSSAASEAFGRDSDDDYIVIAVRDQLALVEVSNDDAVSARHYVVAEVDGSGDLVARTEFGEGELDSAVEALSRRWLDLISDTVPENGQTILAIATATRMWDTRSLALLMADDFGYLDHRPIGFGALDRDGFLALIDASEGIGVQVPREVYRISDAGFVGSFATLSGHHGNDLVEAGISVSVGMFKGGKFWRSESFAENQVDAAIARFEELSAADRSARPDRSLGLPIDLTPDLANRATRLIEERWAGSGSVEVLAVRFDDHALAEVTADSESFFVVLSASADGDDPDEQRYATDELPEAMRVLDSRFVEGLGSSITKGLPTFIAVVAAVNPPDPDALAALYSSEMNQVSHALLLQLAEADSRSEQVDLNVAMSADTDSIIGKVHRLADHLVLSTYLRSDRRSRGERWVSEILLIGREHGGKVDLYESWDVGAMDAANARFDELAAELAIEDETAHSGDSFAELSNAASEAFGRIGGDDYVVIAVRDQLALLDVKTSGGVSTWHYLVVEVDERDQLVAPAEFGSTELAAAIEHLDRRFWELFPEVAPNNGRAILAMGTATRNWDSASFAPFVRHDYVHIDHRQLGFGRLDRDGWLAMMEPSSEVGVFVSRTLYRCSDEGYVASMAVLSGHHGHDLTEAGVSVSLGMVENGKLWWFESFEEGQVDAAVARFDELSATGGALSDRSPTPDLSPDLVNSATRLIEERWAGSGSVEVLAVRFDDHALAEVTSDAEPTFVVLSTPTDGEEPDEQRFAADELPEAMRVLDRRWFDGLGPSATKGLSTFNALIAAMNPPAPDAVAALYSPDFRSTDHDSILQLAQADTPSAQVDAMVALYADSDNICAKVHRLSDHLSLTTFVASYRRSGGERWTSTLIVLAREKAGKVDYIESWDGGEMALANARFDELEAELVTQPPLIPVRSLEVANAATDHFKLNRPDDDFEVVSVLYQNDALVEVRHADGPEFVSVTLTSEGELMTRSYGDQLIDSINGLYRSWIDTLDEQQRPTAELFMEFGLAHHPPVDADRMAALLAEDFEVVAHNQLGALDNATAEEKMAGMVAAGDVMGSVVGRKLLAYSDHVMLSSMETTHQFVNSDRWGHRLLVLVLERQGKVAFQEQWDVEDLDAALARFDELAASTDAAESRIMTSRTA
ncbi:MAG: AAA family ATPase, partial [Actinobacteria bacterium]|nr:AAA family ATPase [Actinomycetota bacterium]